VRKKKERQSLVPEGGKTGEEELGGISTDKRGTRGVCLRGGNKKAKLRERRFGGIGEGVSALGMQESEPIHYNCLTYWRMRDWGKTKTPNTKGQENK